MASCASAESHQCFDALIKLTYAPALSLSFIIMVLWACVPSTRRLGVSHIPFSFPILAASIAPPPPYHSTYFLDISNVSSLLMRIRRVSPLIESMKANPNTQRIDIERQSTKDTIQICKTCCFTCHIFTNDKMMPHDELTLFISRSKWKFLLEC